MNIWIHKYMYMYKQNAMCDEENLIITQQHTQGAGRHLLQAGQAVEDARWHARQLVPVQIKVPVGMEDMS